MLGREGDRSRAPPGEVSPAPRVSRRQHPAEGPSNRKRSKSTREEATNQTLRRFYIFSPDMRINPSDFRFANAAEALIDGITAGRREHWLQGRSLPVCTGLPHLRAKPELVIGVEDDPCDIYGFGPYYVSSRAKVLLSDLDPHGFDFVACQTIDREGTSVEPYWMMAAVRVVDEFDEEHSGFVTYLDLNPADPDRSNRAISILNEISMPADLPVSYHAFFLARYTLHFIVDEVLGDAWRNGDFSGALLTPLQQPTKEDLGSGGEIPNSLLFLNSPYWDDKGSRT